MFLGKKLMFILADFRKNDPCGDSLVTRIYRKHRLSTALTFICIFLSYTLLDNLCSIAVQTTEELREVYP